MRLKTVNQSIHVPEWAHYLISDYSDWDRNPQPVTGEVMTLTLPDNAYFEYAFLDAEGTMRADPVNDVQAESLWYYQVARVLQTPAYRPDYYAPLVRELSVKEAEARPQRAKLESDIMDKTYRLILYTPKDFQQDALPIIYVQDGVSYYRHARLASVLELLLEKNLIRPAHLVFIEPTDRLHEYLYNQDFQKAMLEEIVPYCDNTLAHTGERMLMGASLGGLLSSLLAWENPDIFQTVISQSGAFLGTPEAPEVYDTEASWLLEQLQGQPAKAIRWYLECGSLEWLYKINRAIYETLADKGYDHQYHVRHAGHNWVNWRNGLADALSYALSKNLGR